MNKWVLVDRRTGQRYGLDSFPTREKAQIHLDALRYRAEGRFREEQGLLDNVRVRKLTE